MKVLQVVKKYPPDPDVGGAEVYVYKIVEKLRERNYRVMVATSKYHPGKNTEKGIYRLHSLYFMGISSFMPSLTSYLVKHKNDFDIIHMHVYGQLYTDEISFLKKLKILKGPLIFTPHYHPPIHKRIRIFYDNIFGISTLNIVDKIIVITPFEKKSLVKKGVNAGKIEVIPNGIDSDMFKKTAAEDIRPKYPKLKSNILLYAGRLDELKGVFDLLTIFPEIVKVFPDTCLVFVGKDQGVKKKLVAESIKCGVRDKVFFVGRVPYNELIDWYSVADVFVLPSKYEAWGIACTQAQAAGVPVVATKVGGIPYNVVDKKTGLLCEPGNLEDLRNSILDLLSDKCLRTRLGETGRKWAKQFDWENIIDEIIRVYHEVLNKHEK